MPESASKETTTPKAAPVKKSTKQTPVEKLTKNMKEAWKQRNWLLLGAAPLVYFMELVILAIQRTVNLFSAMTITVFDYILVSLFIKKTCQVFANPADEIYTTITKIWPEPEKKDTKATTDAKEKKVDLTERDKPESQSKTFLLAKAAESLLSGVLWVVDLVVRGIEYVISLAIAIGQLIFDKVLRVIAAPVFLVSKIVTSFFSYFKSVTQIYLSTIPYLGKLFARPAAPGGLIDIAHETDLVLRTYYHPLLAQAPGATLAAQIATTETGITEMCEVLKSRTSQGFSLLTAICNLYLKVWVLSGALVTGSFLRMLYDFVDLLITRGDRTEILLFLGTLVVLYLTYLAPGLISSTDPSVLLLGRTRWSTLFKDWSVERMPYIELVLGVAAANLFLCYRFLTQPVAEPEEEKKGRSGKSKLSERLDLNYTLTLISTLFLVLMSMAKSLNVLAGGPNSVAETGAGALIWIGLAQCLRDAQSLLHHLSTSSEMHLVQTLLLMLMCSTCMVSAPGFVCFGIMGISGAYLISSLQPRVLEEVPEDEVAKHWIYLGIRGALVAIVLSTMSQSMTDDVWRIFVYIRVFMYGLYDLFCSDLYLFRQGIKMAILG
ncbi:hypothetical protein NEDG_00206 [Nematocida displodere]|uniref:Uncharacterized protein n=1 Tax=Nematocida displodere TaxID=1805483 RepID=A0A177EJT8_9MICR|nr:hypothetical protein NEDG_00206 [Nematocida displodere]